MTQRGFLGFALILMVAIAIGFGVYGLQRGASDTYSALPNTAVSTSATTSHVTGTNQPAFPSAGGETAVPAITTPRPATTAVSGITVVSPNGGEILKTGSTYLIQWNFVPGATAGSYQDFKVEAVPSRIDRGPILIASYALSPLVLAKIIPWTIPQTIDTNDTYRIRITYQNTVRTYVDLSDYPFSIQKTMSQEPIRIATQSALARTVDAGAKNIPLVSFIIQTPLGQDALITELALGSGSENSLFNFVENTRLYIDGAKISDLMYDNQFLGSVPLYKLTHPLLIPKNKNITVTVMADLKPSVAGRTLPGLTITGGRGNFVVEGTVVGSDITVR